VVCVVDGGLGWSAAALSPVAEQTRSSARLFLAALISFASNLSSEAMPGPAIGACYQKSNRASQRAGEENENGRNLR
jgi:hypothetical protein